MDLKALLMTAILLAPAVPAAAGSMVEGPRIRGRNGTSTNWSGYAVETNLASPANNVFSNVSGSWVVPSVTCPTGAPNTYSSAWVGLDGYSDNTVEQTGTEQDCINGQPSFYAWYEMYPKPSYRINLPVNPGDTMSATISYAGPSGNKYTLTLVNMSANGGQGAKFTTTVAASSGLRRSAEWIMEAPSSGGVLPLANFGSISFSNAMANNKKISDPSWQAAAITMVGSNDVKAVPSALGSDGSSFSVTWVSST